MLDENNTIYKVYTNIKKYIYLRLLIETSHWTHKIDDCIFIGTDILNWITLVNMYIRYHKIVFDDNKINNYSVELINSLTISNLPPHNLVLKVYCIILLIRNWNIHEKLVNGIITIIKILYPNQRAR